MADLDYKKENMKELHAPDKKVKAGVYVIAALLVLVYLLPIYVMLNQSFRFMTDLSPRLYLPEKWNMSQLYYEEDYAAGVDMTDVCIVHYLDRFKPWWVNFRRCHLFFYQAAAFTPYAKQLTRQFLECNNEKFKNPREEVIRLAARGEIGPRYLGRCLKAWCKAKVRKLVKKK